MGLKRLILIVIVGIVVALIARAKAADPSPDILHDRLSVHRTR